VIGLRFMWLVIGSRGGKVANWVLGALIFCKNVCVCVGGGGGSVKEKPAGNWDNQIKSFTGFQRITSK